MNSDPHDSTAWRSFGMLDSDESAGFDEAMRHDPDLKDASREMDRICAAIALTTSHPIAPRDGHLERIQSRLGLDKQSKASWWFGATGWAAAAALALLLVWNGHITRKDPAENPSLAADPSKPSPAKNQDAPTAAGESLPTPPVTKDAPMTADTGSPTPDTNPSVILVRKETEQLAREIAVLQEQLKSYQQRELALAQVLPGIARPVIMKMTPPGTQPAIDPALAMNDSPISHLLGETQRVTTSPKVESGDAPVNTAIAGDINALTTTDVAPVAAPPGAIPIYDAARDAGTLVVSNLPPAAEGQEYNLWVQTTRDEPPVRLGILPDAGTSSSESFDFSLGGNRTLPSGFILTQDPKDKPSTPTAKNTVLLSPQPAEP